MSSQQGQQAPLDQIYIAFLLRVLLGKDDLDEEKKKEFPSRALVHLLDREKAAGDVPMGSSAEPQYFFGEDYTAHGIHIVTAAYLVLLFEALSLLISLAVLPLTVISFDVSSVVTAVANGGALLFALMALIRHKHKYLWPFMVIKVSEIFLYILLFLTALVLSCTRPSAVIHFMRWRVRTIEHDNQILHIVALLVIFFLYVVYCIMALSIIHRGFVYIREKCIYLYMEERRLAFQHIIV